MRLSAFLAVAVAVAGCATAPSEPPRRTIAGPSIVSIDEQDALVELKPGARVHVKLEAEKISKRRWHVTAVSGEAIRPHGNPWFTTKHVYALREPGNWMFDFDAVAPGSATVTFDYRRDDEPVSAAEHTAKFEFVVR